MSQSIGRPFSFGSEQMALGVMFAHGLSVEEIATMIMNSSTVNQSPDINRAVGKFTTNRKDIILLLLRWHTEIGRQCLHELKKFLSTSKPVIDLMLFKFNYKGIQLSLNDFSDRSVQMSRVGGYADVRGCPLENLILNNVILANGCFNYCNFENSHWQQVEIKNCNLVMTSFIKSRLVMIRFGQNVRLGDCDFRGAFLNSIDFASPQNYITVNWKFNELTYFELVRHCLIGLSGRFSMISNSHSTVFWMIQLPKGDEHIFNSAEDYIAWFQQTHYKLQKIEKSSILQKLWISIEIIFSKNWKSFGIFAFWIIFMILGYAFIFYGFSLLDKLNGSAPTLFEAFYYSVVTFTTLGCTDIAPNGTVGRVFTILLVMSGCISLGMLLTILAKKLTWK